MFCHKNVQAELKIVTYMGFISFVIIRVARWPFFGPFLAHVAIFESHFLEKKLFGYKLNFGYFVAIFENSFL